jgi:tRNA-dihydrouridine synthase B
MKLDSHELGRIFLAPLSGVADSPFRRICKRFGAEVVYSEMVSSEGVSRGGLKSVDIMRFHPEERPIGIQIFGSDPLRMARSAELVAEAEPDFIDINMACPARRVVNRGAGCALLRQPERLSEIARSVVSRVMLPVTAKIRIGWDEGSINGVDVARLLEDQGVVGVSVHGRTWKQGFRDRASWDEVARVKRAVTIPVILSGDVRGPEDAEKAFTETGCDAVMIGRGIYGRPWLFREIHAYLEGGSYAAPDRRTVKSTILSHLDLGIAEFGEQLATVRFRKHLLWYTKGIHGVVALRPDMSHVTTREDVVEILDRILARAPG